jgi:hypothetical protein
VTPPFGFKVISGRIGLIENTCVYQAILFLLLAPKNNPMAMHIAAGKSKYSKCVLLVMGNVENVLKINTSATAKAPMAIYFC